MLLSGGRSGDEADSLEADSIAFNKLERLPSLRSLNEVGLKQAIVVDEDVGDVDRFRTEVVRQHRREHVRAIAKWFRKPAIRAGELSVGDKARVVA